MAPHQEEWLNDEEASDISIFRNHKHDIFQLALNEKEIFSNINMI